MSEENVDLLRQGLAGWNTGDLETWRELAAPGIEFVQAPEVPGATIHRGKEEVLEFIEELLGVWDRFEIEIDELIDVDPDVVVVASVRLKGKASGVESEMPWAWVFTFGDGKVIRMQSFLQRAAALEAAGVLE